MRDRPDSEFCRTSDDVQPAWRLRFSWLKFSSIRIVVGCAADFARRQEVFTFTSATVHELVYGREFKAAAGQLKKALDWLSPNEQITPSAAFYLEAAIFKAAARKPGSILEILELPDCHDSRQRLTSIP